MVGKTKAVPLHMSWGFPGSPLGCLAAFGFHVHITIYLNKFLHLSTSKMEAKIKHVGIIGFILQLQQTIGKNERKVNQKH